jgi:hypothetical protein
MALERNRMRKNSAIRNLLTWLLEEFTLFRVSFAIVFLSFAYTKPRGSVRAYKLLLIISVWLSHTFAFHSQHSCRSLESIRVTERSERFLHFETAKHEQILLIHKQTFSENHFLLPLPRYSHIYSLYLFISHIASSCVS